MARLLTVWVVGFVALHAAGNVLAAGRKDPALTINGVGLGTELAHVRQVLGRPLSEVDNPADDMPEMGPGKTLKYEGLVLELCMPEGRKDFHVWSMVVTSKRWVVVPGLRVGMGREAVIRALGPPENMSLESELSRESLAYNFLSFDGFYSVTLEKGRVVEINASEDWS